MTPSETTAAEPRTWTPQDSAELYGLEEWGGGYFGVSPEGTVEVYPDGQRHRKIDLLEVVKGLEVRDFVPPLVVRFDGILAHRMAHLRTAFDEAISDLERESGVVDRRDVEVEHIAGKSRAIASLKGDCQVHGAVQQAVSIQTVQQEAGQAANGTELAGTRVTCTGTSLVAVRVGDYANAITQLEGIMQ